jgi:hypothetical protein
MNWYKRAQQDQENDSNDIYYHGTDSTEVSPETFRTVNKSINETTFGPVETIRHGVFLSSSEDFAKEFGHRVIRVKAKIKRTANVEEEQIDFINSLNPFGRDRDLWVLAKNTKEPWGMFESELGERFVDFLKSKGYDSAEFQETMQSGLFSGEDVKEFKSNTLVVFDPKSIIGFD